MTITLNIDCLLELVKAALLVVRFEFQIPNYILSKDDASARAKRYTLMIQQLIRLDIHDYAHALTVYPALSAYRS